MNSSRAMTMKRTFLRWVLLVIGLAFLLTLFFSFAIQTRHAQTSAVNLINLKIEDTEKQVQQNNKNLTTIKEINRSEALAKARSLAKILENNPTADLQSLLKVLDVDEIDIINQNGIIVNCTNPNYINYDMSSAEQSREFLAILENPQLEIVQEPRSIGYDSSITMQYTGVARLDQPGLIQIAYYPERLYEAMKMTDITQVAYSQRIGTNGNILVIRDQIISSSIYPEAIGKNISIYGIDHEDLTKKTPFTITILGEKCYCMADSYEGYYIVGIYPYSEMFSNRKSTALFLIICNLVLFATIFLLISRLTQTLVISGIYKINNSLEKITKGNLEEKIQVETSQEFCSLSEGINTTVSALKQAINDAAARLDQELELAKAIQASALPRKFPPYPERTEFDLYASMVPAREVGGDFYDFFLIDENHLAILIADVSGKGIPAALFMMTGKTLIKNLAETGLPPEEVLSMANDHLCLNNDAGMFITAWLGIWEISTGKLSYTNAGHNYPIYKKANGQFEILKAKSGFVLAGMEGLKYKRNEMQTTPGDIIFLYTDGVTEAENVQKEFFGEERLLNVLNQHQNNSIQGILQNVSQSLEDFRQEADQFDDITMLGLQINNFNRAEEGKMKRLALPAKVEELDNLLNFIRENMQKANCSDKVLFQLELVCEEVFVNIARYAYEPQAKQALVWCDLAVDEQGVMIVFTDRGRQFNPLRRPDPNIEASLEDKPIGGLGIFLTKKTMDLVEYTYRFGRNILTLHKKF